MGTLTLSPQGTTPANTPVAAPAGRRSHLLGRLRELMLELSGIQFTNEETGSSFIEMGLDSLFLTQWGSRVEAVFSVQIKFRQLMEDLCSLDALARFLDEQLPPDPPQPQAMPTSTAAPALEIPAALPPIALHEDPIAPAQVPQLSLSEKPLEALFAQQLEIIRRQLQILSGGAAPATTPIAPAARQVATPAGLPEQPLARRSAENGTSPAPTTFGAGAAIQRSQGSPVSGDQGKFVEAFAARYSAKTARSKEYVQRHRARFADPRSVTGFHPLLKEVVYPLVVDKSSGSKVWDIDGNVYVDMAGCFGANLLGHSPPFVTQALRDQIEKGIEIGPQHPLAGEAADLMSELTGLERVVFCNTGSEAVMGAMRLARTVTGRNLIVTFADSYHGNFDEVIVRANRGGKTMPAAPGIPSSKVANLLVLPYGSDEALRVIQDKARELAAVMVEPVQSRNLSLQPREFLNKLREITAQAGVALIFDEVITGFRAHLGGAQAYFGVKADIAAYGKIVGGGMPIGAIAGIPHYMDALDGGFWRFGDESTPEAGVTYFAGTYVRHPLAMAAGLATLAYLKEQGPRLQERLSARMAGLVDDLREHFRASGAPVEIKSFASACRLYLPHDQPLAGLFYALLRDKGVHIYEGRTWFLTTAHDSEDIELVSRAIKESTAEMMRAGLFPCRLEDRSLQEPKQAFGPSPPVAGARLGRDLGGAPAWFVEDPARKGKFLMVGSGL